ncbi:MAG: DUF6599 family protein [Acidobacteriaceae bacterium]
MLLRRIAPSLLSISLLCPCAFAAAKLQVGATAAPAPLLPPEFAAWQLQGSLEKTTQPQTADAANAGVLKEYGFTDYAGGNYSENGNSLTVRAMRFADATGAYGAYTYYRIPGMHPEDIGRGAAANGSRILFWNGATLVDAKFDHLTAMSAAELRELAGKLPVPNGTGNIPPSLPGYLPRKNLDITFTRYSLGPEAYMRTGGVLPPSLIDFTKSPEVLSGAYTVTQGSGLLTLIEYPTPQIAADRERAIAAYLKSGRQQGGQASAPWPQPLAESSPNALLTRRSGLLVGITSGSLPASDAQALLDRINYEASVTWNHPQGYVPETAKAASLLLGIAALCGILAGTALILGIFLGGGRALFRRLRGKPASSLAETEFIRLDLR